MAVPVEQSRDLLLGERRRVRRRGEGEAGPEKVLRRDGYGGVPPEMSRQSVDSTFAGTGIGGV